MPEELQDMVVFTIKESKGLEFNDVILYNFFGSSTQYKCWNYLRSCEINLKEYNEEQYQELLKRKSLTIDGVVDGMRIFAPQYEDGIYSVPSMLVDKKISWDDTELYNYINDELKALYVAITRAKNTFVVYDHGSASKNRTNMDEIWKMLNCVNFISTTDIQHGAPE